MEACTISTVYFLDHHTPIQIAPKPTKALYTAFVHLQCRAITNPVLKVEFCRSPGSGSHTHLHGMQIHN